MNRSSSHIEHSAEVKMHLVVDGQKLPIAQLGPDFLILRKTVDHPPADAILFVSIDGKVREWEIRLPDGILVGSRRVAIGKA
jgi:hypothetical protein